MQFPGMKVLHVITVGSIGLLSTLSSVSQASSSVSLVSGGEASRKQILSSSNAQVTNSSGASVDSVIIVIGPWPNDPVITLGGVQVHHQFAGPAGDGSHPVSLVSGGDGTLYGSTRAGGANDAGTLFKVSQPGIAGGAYSLLHSFDGAAGGKEPAGTLVVGVDGSIYGVAERGGAYGYGAIFKMSPAGNVQVLHSFGAGISEGSESIVNPVRLMQAGDGNFYGLAADTIRPGVSEFVGTLRRALFKMSPGGEVTVVGRFSVPAATVVTETGYAPDVSPIVERNGGRLYFVSDDKLYQFDRGESQLVEVTLPAGLSRPGNLLRASNGNIYGTASSNSGTVLFRIAAVDGFVTQLPGSLSDLPSPLILPALPAVLPPHGVPTALAEGANGTLYGIWSRAGESYVFSINPAANQGPEILRRLPDPTVGEYRSLMVSNSGFLGGITTGGGFGSLFSYLPSHTPNRAPVALDDQFQSALSTTDGIAAIPTRVLTANLLANDSDPDNEPLSIISVTSNAPNATIELGLNGTVKVIQTDGFMDSVVLNYTVMDARGATASAKAVFEYTAPVARDDLFRLRPGTRNATIQAVNNDTSVNSASLVIKSCSKAKYGRVTISGDGKSLLYKPGPLYRDKDSFTYTIGDGYGGTATAKVRIENPFVGVKGEYYGVINRPQAVGSVRLSMSSSGALTGALYYGGQVVRFRGRLSTDGGCEIPISIKGAGRMTLHVSAGRGQTPRINAAVEINGSGILLILFDAAPSRIAINTPNELAGKYTVALPADPMQGAYYPQGDGFALLKVGANGAAKLVGRLGDGTAFSAGTLLLADGSLPFYLDAYTKRVGASGGISGKLHFANTQESDVSGELVWIKPKQASGAYAGGFRGKISAVGSRWVPPSQLVNQAQIWREGAMLHMGDGELPDKIKKRVDFSAGTDLVLSPLGADQMQLQIDPVTGFFGGEFIHPETRTTHPIQGVILQKQRSAAGVFAGESTTGWVLIEPRE